MIQVPWYLATGFPDMTEGGLLLLKQIEPPLFRSATTLISPTGLYFPMYKAYQEEIS